MQAAISELERSRAANDICAATDVPRMIEKFLTALGAATS